MLCTGKESFPSFGAASKILKRMHQRHECALRVYRCAECSEWHIGSTINRLQREHRKVHRKAA